MAANDTRPSLGRDLLLTPFYQATSWGTLDLVTQPPGAVPLDEPRDLDVASEGNCLRQALILRLLTPVGSLRELGHAGYGSRLHELIGQPHTAANRLRARAFVLQALAQEHRVARVVELRVEPDPASADRLHISVQVLPVGSGDPLSLGLEVQL